MKHDNSCVPFLPRIEDSFKIIHDKYLGENDLINDLVADIGQKLKMSHNYCPYYLLLTKHLVHYLIKYHVFMVIQNVTM